MKDICTNCGAWRGLHEMETDKCPLGGIERFPNVWGKTYYAEQDDNIEDLKKEFSDFRAAVAKDQADDLLLIAELRDTLNNATAALRFKEFEQDGATIRELREKLDKLGAEYAAHKSAVTVDANRDTVKICNLGLELDAANRAASANLRMAQEQAEKVGALKMALSNLLEVLDYANHQVKPRGAVGNFLFGILSQKFEHGTIAEAREVLEATE